MNKHILFLAFSLFFSAVSCDKDKKDTPPTPVNPPETKIEVPSFALGADVSWTSEMESEGKSFKNASKIPTDIFTVLKECGVNAIRLRVWVDPYKGWSAKDDMVSLAVRANSAGLPLMVDFHYSDFFTDPSRQGTPEAWVSDKDDIDKMCTHVAEFTREVLNALKDKGVSPAWIQIGNETRNGMLWPSGQLWTSSGDIDGGWTRFTKLFNSGYNAAKSVFPSALVMPHLNNAYEDNAWWFTALRKNGGKFDMIALSHYPQTNSKTGWEDMNKTAAARINALGESFGVKVMVSEVGVKFSDVALGKKVLSDFLTRIKGLDCCAGVFYWEPEVYGWWKPALYGDASAIKKYTGKSETWNAYDMGAFSSDGSPSAILEAFKQ